MPVADDPLIQAAIDHLSRGHTLEEQGASEIDLCCQAIAQAFEREGGEIGFVRWCRDELKLPGAPRQTKFSVFAPYVKYIVSRCDPGARPVPAYKVTKIASVMTTWATRYRKKVPADQVGSWLHGRGGYQDVYEENTKRDDAPPQTRSTPPAASERAGASTSRPGNDNPSPPLKAPWLHLPAVAPAGQEFVVRYDSVDRRDEELMTTDTLSEAIDALRGFCADGWDDDADGEMPDDDFTLISKGFSMFKANWSISLRAKQTVDPEAVDPEAQPTEHVAEPVVAEPVEAEPIEAEPIEADVEDGGLSPAEDVFLKIIKGLGAEESYADHIEPYKREVTRLRQRVAALDEENTRLRQVKRDLEAKVRELSLTHRLAM